MASIFPKIPTTSTNNKLVDVTMALTPYDDYKDFCEKCKEFNVEIFMDEKGYIEWFNEMWGSSYEECLEWHRHW